MLIVSALIILVCILLVLVVLIQNPKGGGLASGFSASNQMMGVRRTADFLEKSTWTLAIVLLLLSVTTTAMIGKGKKTVTGGSTTRNAAGQFESPKTAPTQTAPTPQPGAGK